MATITFSYTVDDLKVQAIKDDFAAAKGWTLQIPDPNNLGQLINNPISQNQWMKNAVADHIKREIKNYRVEKARVTAGLTAEGDADTNIVLT